MRRSALTSAALLCCLALSTAAFAQSAKSTASTPAKKDAAPAVAPAPPSPEVMKARMRPPVKGTAFVEFITVSSKAVKDEIVTQLKIRNISNAPIVGMKVDQYFYAGKQEVSAGTGRVRNPMAPGEIIDLTVASPMKPGITGNQMMFSHANGQVKPTSVKKFTEDAKKK